MRKKQEEWNPGREGEEQGRRKRLKIVDEQGKSTDATFNKMRYLFAFGL